MVALKQWPRWIEARLSRFWLLLETEGSLSAAARAIRSVAKGNFGDAHSPVVRKSDLDPSKPGVLASRRTAQGPTGTATLTPVNAYNQIGEGASVCFVVRVTSNDGDALDTSVQSILSQTVPNWEILFSVADSVDIDLGAWLDVDWRIRRLPESLDGRSDLNVAAQYSTTRFVGPVWQGDIIDEGLVDAISASTKQTTTLIYTDEGKILGIDRTGDYLYKPDWSPEYFCSFNYLGRFFALRKSLLLTIGTGQYATQIISDFALGLEAMASGGDFVHIDEALYFSAINTPLSPWSGATEQGLDCAINILDRHVRLENPSAVVREGAIPGALRIDWPVSPETPVSLVILTGLRERNVEGRGHIVLATHFVRSIIDRSTFSGYRIELVHDGQAPEDLLAMLDRHGHRHHSYPNSGAFSFAKKANYAVNLVEEGVVVLLNDDMEVISPDWIEAMAGLAQRPAIGAVGAKLLYPNGSIQHAGVALGFPGSTGHIFHRSRAEGGEYGALASVTRNVSAVTGAAMAFRKAVFSQLNGFDETFSIDYNDIDFCLRLQHAGYRIAYSPDAKLYHFHNSSLMRKSQDPMEQETFALRWRDVILHDPYFSRHFQRRHSDLPPLSEAG